MKPCDENASEYIDKQPLESQVNFEQEYKVLFNTSLFCVFLLDFEGNVLDANECALNLLGYTREDIPLYNIASLVGPDQLAAAFQTIEEIKQEGSQRSPVEFIVKKKNGEHVWLEVEGALIRRDKNPYAILGVAQNVTSHKVTEQILRESENRYRSIFENTGTATIIVEEDTTISMMNRECEKLTGFSKKEVEGKKSWTEFVIREELERLREYHRLRATEPDSVPRTYETGIIDKQGNVRNIVVTASMIPGTKQRVVSLLDITEQRAAEKGLEESETKFRALVEQIPNTIVYTAALDERSTTLYVSPQIGKILGYDREEYRENPDLWAQRIHPDDFSRVMAELEHCRKTGAPFVSEYRIRRKDGKAIWFHDEAHVIRGKQGDPHFLLGTNTDITHRKQIEEALKKTKDDLEIKVQERTADLMTVNTQLETEIAERKRAQEILRESEERFRALAENTSDWIWEVDQSLVYAYASPKVKDLLGYEPDEVIGKTPFDLMPQHEATRISETFRPILASRNPFKSVENINLHKDGHEVIIETSGVPIFDKNGNFCGFRGIDRDVTERKRAEEIVKTERMRLYNVLETLPVYVILLTPDYHVSFANRFFRERFGEPRGKRCFEFLFGRKEPCENCETYTTLKIKAPHHWAWTGPDGRNYDIHDFPFADTDGSTLILEMGIDVSERKKAEKALQEVNETLEQRVAERTAALLESEERLRFALETSHTGSWDLDLADHIVHRSLEHDRIFGYDELLPQWTYEMFLSHVLPEDRIAVNSKFRQAVKSHGDWSFECRIRRTGGEIRWIWAAGRPRTDSAGQTRLMAGIIQDITDLKRAEQEVRERQADLEKQAKDLQEMNAALNVLLKKRETDRAELEKNVLSNIRQVIDPYLAKLKRSGLDERQKALTAVLESNLKEITSSFAYTLSSVRLDMTPKEVKVASLIKQGKTTKEICEILGSSEKAVAFHRQNIRKKLGLLNKKVNLRSHLNQFWRKKAGDSPAADEYTDEQDT